MARPLIVLGMARSGTTIMARVLASHPDVELYTSGSESRLLECDELRREGRRLDADGQRLRAIVDRCGKKYLLLKRPWAEEDPLFFRRFLPDGRYIIMLRPRAEQIAAWRRSPLSGWVHRAPDDLCEAAYRRFRRAVDEFEEIVEAPVLLMRLKYLRKSPGLAASMAGEFLDLDASRFDVSMVLPPGRPVEIESVHARP